MTATEGQTTTEAKGAGPTRADWNTMTVREQAAYNAGYSDGARNPMAEAAMRRIMRTLGIIGASYSEIAEQVETRLNSLRISDKFRAERSKAFAGTIHRTGAKTP